MFPNSLNMGLPQWTWVKKTCHVLDNDQLKKILNAFSKKNNLNFSILYVLSFERGLSIKTLMSENQYIYSAGVLGRTLEPFWSPDWNYPMRAVVSDWPQGQSFSITLVDMLYFSMCQTDLIWILQIFGIWKDSFLLIS